MPELSSTFRRFAEIIGALEATDTKTESVTISSLQTAPQTDSTATVDVEVHLPLLPKETAPEVTAQHVSLTDEGTLELELQIASHSTHFPDVAQSNGSPTTTTTDSTDTTTDTAAAANNSTHYETTRPAYRDPDRLKEVYKKYDTFQEMTDALDVDVVPQTVRHYMIKHAIHEPATQSESQPATPVVTDGHGNASDELEMGRTPSTVSSPTDADPARNASHPQQAPSEVSGATESTTSQISQEIAHHQCEQEYPAAIELPTDMVDDVKACARQATTLTGVQHQLGLDRTQTRHLLQELGVLEWVRGPLATGSLQNGSLRKINQQLDVDNAQS